MNDKKRIEKDFWELVKVEKKFQITIPKRARENLGITIGSFLAARIENKKLVLTLKFLVDKKEVVLSKSGEKKMLEALDDVEKGRITEVK